MECNNEHSVSKGHVIALMVPSCFTVRLEYIYIHAELAKAEHTYLYEPTYSIYTLHNICINHRTY